MKYPKFDFAADASCVKRGKLETPAWHFGSPCLKNRLRFERCLRPPAHTDVLQVLRQEPAGM